MLKNIIAVAAAGLAASASATTLTVDGVGSGGNYATISEAIIALGADGTDGVPDKIDVTADVLNNHPAILLNGTSAAIDVWPRLTDDLIIDGNADANANNCRLALGANIGALTGIGVPGSRIAVELAAAQKITISNFIIIPESTGAAGGSVAANAITVDEADASTVFNSAEFNLSNCVFTASADTDNTPLAVTAAVPAGVTPTFFGGDSSSLAAFLSMQSQPAGAQVFTHTISNCTFAHGRRDHLFIGSDANATGTGVVNITSSRSTRCVQGGLGDGILLNNAENITLNLTSMTCDFNDEHGINATSSGTAGNFMKLNINQGCSFSSNSFRGIALIQSGAASTSRIRMTIAGTAASRVLVASNSNRGLRSECVSSAPAGVAPQVVSVDYLTMRSNSILGWEFNEADLNYPTAAGPQFSNCIFARNGSLSPTFAQFLVQDTNTAAGGVQFNNCSFYDPHATANTVGSSIATNASVAANLTYNIRNSIFSGSDFEDIAIQNNSSGANVLYELTNCSLVAFGPQQLAAIPIVLTAAATVNQNNVITADPVYQNLTLTNANFLRVRNGSSAPDGYAGAAEGSQNLTGAVTFVGDARVKIVEATGATTLHGATLNTTDATYPFEWIVYNPATDPNTIDPDGIRAVRDTTKYWDIQFYPAASAPTADLTLPWPDSAGFEDGGIYHYSTSDSKWLYGEVASGSGTPGAVDTSGDPNLVTHTGVTSFSPFSVGSVGAVPVTLSGFEIE